MEDILCYPASLLIQRVLVDSGLVEMHRADRAREGSTLSLLCIDFRDVKGGLGKREWGERKRE